MKVEEEAMKMVATADQPADAGANPSADAAASNSADTSPFASTFARTDASRSIDGKVTACDTANIAGTVDLRLGGCCKFYSNCIFCLKNQLFDCKNVHILI